MIKKQIPPRTKRTIENQANWKLFGIWQRIWYDRVMNMKYYCEKKKLN